MRSRLALFMLLAVVLVFALLFGRQAYLSRDLPRDRFTQKTLHVLTYSTFVGSSGPGGWILDQFKRRHGCEVDVQTAGDAGLLLERVRLTEGNSPFDVVIGLDQILLNDASLKIKWRELQVERLGWNAAVVELNQDSRFVPFDWSPMTFVYRKSATAAPANFQELASEKWRGKIALQDPRSSSPGMQFVRWVKAIEGDHAADFLREFKPNVASVSPSWAFSYGLFKKKQADFVFSYLTSLAFHWGFEKDRDYQVVNLPEGHVAQVEYAAVPASCRECDLAELFVREMMEPESQKLIMEKNFMFPVVEGLTAGTIFSELPQLKSLPISAKIGNDLSDWDQVFKR